MGLGSHCCVERDEVRLLSWLVAEKTSLTLAYVSLQTLVYASLLVTEDSLRSKTSYEVFSATDD